MKNIMIDLETLGTFPGCAILSIGAVEFDLSTGTLGREFYVNIDTDSQLKMGLVSDPATELWWASQSLEAREALNADRHFIAAALFKFSDFYKMTEAERIWGHGASFDAPVLDAAYRATGIVTPWKYSAPRCTRTLYELADIEPDRSSGVHHNALNDAIVQARAAIEAAWALGL